MSISGLSAAPFVIKASPQTDKADFTFSKRNATTGSLTVVANDVTFVVPGAKDVSTMKFTFEMPLIGFTQTGGVLTINGVESGSNVALAAGTAPLGSFDATAAPKITRSANSDVFFRQVTSTYLIPKTAAVPLAAALKISIPSAEAIPDTGLPVTITGNFSSITAN